MLQARIFAGPGRKGILLTQEELALMSGLSQGYINQLESGKRKITQKTLTAIAKALGLPLYMFFEEEGKEKKIQERVEPYAKRPPTREVFKVLKALPPHIVNHYMILMSIEKDLYEKKKSKRLVSGGGDLSHGGNIREQFLFYSFTQPEELTPQS